MFRDLLTEENGSRHGSFRRISRFPVALAFVLSVFLAGPSVGQASTRTTLEGVYPLASLRVMSECVERLRAHFLRPEKIVPRLMTARAIEFLQGAVTPLLVRRE